MVFLKGKWVWNEHMYDYPVLFLTENVEFRVGDNRRFYGIQYSFDGATPPVLQYFDDIDWVTVWNADIGWIDFEVRTMIIDRKFSVSDDFYLQVLFPNATQQSVTLTLHTYSTEGTYTRSVFYGYAPYISNPTKEGYDFIGWSYKEKEYEPVNLLTELTEDTTFYAWYESKSESVKVKFQDSTNLIEEVDVVKDSNELSNGHPFTYPAYEESGYTFLGWSKSNVVRDFVTSDTTYSTDTTLFAVTQIKTLNVTFYNTGIVQEVKYGGVAKNIKRDGVNGWTKIQDSNITYSFTEKVYESFTLYPIAYSEDFTASLYKMSCEKNYVKKSTFLSLISQYKGTLREGCSLTSPVLVIEQDTLPTVNYCYLPRFGRYYFIDNIVNVRYGVWELHLSVDVLYTYMDEILMQNAYVLRNEYKYTKYVDDNLTVLLNAREEEIDSYDSIFSTENYQGVNYCVTVVSNQRIGDR